MRSLRCSITAVSSRARSIAASSVGEPASGGADDHDVKLIRLREERLDVDVALSTVRCPENKAESRERTSAGNRVPFLSRMSALQQHLRRV